MALARHGSLGVLLGVLAASAAGAQPSSNLDDYALFAERSISTKELTVADGDIGVNQADGRLDAPKSPAIDAPNSVVAAAAVSFEESARCLRLFANAVGRTASSCGPATALVTPIIPDLARACGFPVPFPACNASSSITVQSGETRTLGPGVYGTVRLKSTRVAGVVIPGTLELTGGAYVFCGLRAGREARILFQGPSAVDVVGSFNLGNGSVTGPAPGSGLRPSDIRFFANGSSVHLSRQSEVTMRLCAPGAQLRVTQGAILAGHFFALRAQTERIVFPVCGDRRLDGKETCDPPGSDPAPPGGNLCRADCTYCGDVKMQAGEECDDGNTIDDDICHDDCTFNQPPGCGNGVLDPGETCDPPGSDPAPPGGNLCRLTCTSCGDGITTSGEQCDDGNTIDGDACHNDCTPAPQRCGNGAIDAGETCDPPGSDPAPPGGNLCRLTCTSCGDGITTDGEQCDDANTVDGDACHNDCTMP